MRRISDIVAVVIVAAIGVLQLVAALVIVLVVVLAIGVALLRRARYLDRSFAEILHRQEQQRRLLTVGRGSPGPPPIRG